LERLVFLESLISFSSHSSVYFLDSLVFFWWGLLSKEKTDERLDENLKRAASIAGRMGTALCFCILFALDKKLSTEFVLLWGSIGYAAVMVSSPAIAYFFDKRGGGK
jgi:hypothetical protein